MEQKLHNTAIYYMMCMAQQYPKVDPYKYSLDEFLDEYVKTLTMADIYLGQSILNLFKNNNYSYTKFL